MQRKLEVNRKSTEFKTILWSIAMMRSIQNTININVILDGIRKLPLLGPIIPEWVYGLWIIKLLATISSVIRELFMAFAGRFFLILCLFFASGLFSSGYDAPQVDFFLYFFLIVELMGVLLTNAFRVSTETDYSVFHLRMDAKQYVLSRLFGDSVITFLGYILFGIPAALLAEVKWYVALLLPLSALGFKIASIGGRMAFYSLIQRSASKKHSDGKGLTGKASKQITISGNDNLTVLLLVVLFFGGGIGGIGLFYFFSGNPAFHILLVLFVVLGALLFLPGFVWIRRFSYGLYRTALSAERIKYEAVLSGQKRKRTRDKEVKIGSTENVGVDPRLVSKRTGFGYLNDIFLKRHRKLFLSRALIDVLVTGGLVAAVSAILYVEVAHYHGVNSVVRYLVCRHPGIFPFLLFVLHSGPHMCHAMYVNCDSTMLIYGFYRTPEALMKMFRVRLWSVIRYNLAPVLMLSIFSVAAVLLTGGEGYPLQILFQILEMGSFQVLFSAGYLASYYLLQPYGEELSLGSRITSFFNLLIGFLLFVLMFLPVNAVVLTIAGVLSSILLLFVSGRLIRRFGPKTFR